MTEAQVVELVAMAMFDHFSKRKTWTGPSWSQIAEDARDEWCADARAAITACQHAIAPENKVVELVAIAIFDNLSKRSREHRRKHSIPHGPEKNWSQISKPVRNSWKGEARVAITAYRHAIVHKAA